MRSMPSAIWLPMICEIRLVPFAEAHRVAIFGRQHADEAIADRQRNGQRALRIGQSWQRNVLALLVAARPRDESRGRSARSASRLVKRST